MLGRFSAGKWTRDFSSFGGIQFQNLFQGKGVYTPGQYILLGGGCLQGKSLCFKIAVLRVLQSLNFMTENGPWGREPTENKIVGDETRKLLTEQFSPLIDGLVGDLH